MRHLMEKASWAAVRTARFVRGRRPRGRPHASPPMMRRGDSNVFVISKQGCVCFHLCVFALIKFDLPKTLAAQAVSRHPLRTGPRYWSAALYTCSTATVLPRWYNAGNNWCVAQMDLFTRLHFFQRADKYGFPLFDFQTPTCWRPSPAIPHLTYSLAAIQSICNSDYDKAWQVLIVFVQSCRRTCEQPLINMRENTGV